MLRSSIDTIAGRLGLPPTAPAVAVVRLAGIIGDGRSRLRRGELNLGGLARTFERAFALPALRAVALQINSPGGAPVQSALLHRRIRQLSAEKSVPVFAFVEDVAASGGYWLALAGDEIYADANSIVGSIGVVSASFGLQELIARYGIERRLYTAGDKKSLLDPFLPAREDEVRRLQAIQAEMHENFKEVVRLRRAARLKGEERDLFSGEFWTGRRAQELGLIDGLGDLATTMKERFGDKVRLVSVGDHGGWIRRRLGVAGPGDAAAAGGFDFAAGALAAVEERLIWSRFGR